MKVNREEAEFIGMHVGDGTFYRTNTGYVWEMRGSLKEKEYYDKYVSKLIKNLFGFDVKPKIRNDGKNGVYGLQLCKKELIQFLFKAGFKTGSKVYTCNVPNYIMNANKHIKIAFLRGLFDTDGCFTFHRKKNRTIYPKTELGFASENLVLSLKVMLNSLGFRPNFWICKSFRGNKLRIFYKLRINGLNAMNFWMEMIGSRNPKNLNKYLWLKNKCAEVA